MMAFEKGDGDVQILEKFPDVKTSEWYAKPLARAVELGIMKGYPNGKMKPAYTINMVEAVKMVVEVKYPDKDFTPKEGKEWYTEYVKQAKKDLSRMEYKLVRKINELEPEMTRYYAVVLIESLLEGHP